MMRRYALASWLAWWASLASLVMGARPRLPAGGGAATPWCSLFSRPKGNVLLPVGKERLEAGDQLAIAGTSGSIEAARLLLVDGKA